MKIPVLFKGKNIKSMERHISGIERDIKSLEPRNKNIAGIYHYLSDNSGKLLRPRLLFYFCRYYRIRINTDIKKTALALELIHTASLLQDDVFDNERIRRNRPSPNLVFGDTKTILTSDYLLIKALDIMREVKRKEIADILYECAIHTCCGEMDSCELDNPDNITLKKYFSVIEQKTASLFRVGGELVNILKKGTHPEAYQFGRIFGTFYQILDDLKDSHDYLESSGRKTTLKNLVCLPLVFAFSQEKNRPLLRNDTTDYKRILGHLQKCGAYKKSLEYVTQKYDPIISQMQKKHPEFSEILDKMLDSIKIFLKAKCNP